MVALRLGLITVASEDKTWPRMIIDEFTRKHQEAQRALAGLGFEVVVASQNLGRDFKDMIAQARYLRYQGIHVLVIFVPDWTYASHSVVAGMDVGVPVLVWADDTPGHSGIVGASIVRGSLDEVGVMTKLVHGAPSNEGVLQAIRQWCRGVGAATSLRGNRIGIGGSRSMGMYTAQVDPSMVMRQFGVDLDGWEQLDVIQRGNSFSQGEVEEVYKWICETFGGLEAKKEVVEAQIRMYLALLTLIKEKRYDAVCVKCLPDLPGCHTTFCFAMAILNDLSDHRGKKQSLVCGCEADVNGTLTMQLLKNLSGGPTMFADVIRLYYDRNEVGLMNCGSSATDFASTKRDVHWVREGLLEFEWKMGGMCPQYITREGQVTLARLGRINGQFVMLITGGRTVSYPREKLADMNPNHPQSYVRLDCSLDQFLLHLRCNHIHFAFGDFKEELQTACEVLGVKPILLA